MLNLAPRTSFRTMRKNLLMATSLSSPAILMSFQKTAMRGPIPSPSPKLHRPSNNHRFDPLWH
ncbi:hypothetical protein B0H10DRAFT_2136738 [Mycena sp. CBHHK59/15]|nr:hypothetical protein B0H10DRAFT_2136738 [Mycena sp. CBHHK59/15]